MLVENAEDHQQPARMHMLLMVFNVCSCKIWPFAIYFQTFHFLS